MDGLCLYISRFSAMEIWDGVQGNRRKLFFQNIIFSQDAGEWAEWI